MEDFGFKEMQQIQMQLQERYKDKWRPLSPQLGTEQLLWHIDRGTQQCVSGETSTEYEPVVRKTPEKEKR